MALSEREQEAGAVSLVITEMSGLFLGVIALAIVLGVVLNLAASWWDW